MLKIVEPIKTMDSLLPCLGALLKAFFNDQNCNHKDCSTCHIRVREKDSIFFYQALFSLYVFREVVATLGEMEQYHKNTWGLSKL
jgi:hypothetical protein